MVAGGCDRRRECRGDAAAAGPGDVAPGSRTHPAELVRATAHWTGADSAGFLFGAGAGGILIALTATGAVVAIAAGLAALTTLLAVGLPATIASEASEETDDAGLLVGVRGVLATPPLYAPFVLLIGLLVLEGATDVQLVALAIDRLGLVTAVAGATVISAGSTGDAFFVVDTGVLDVVEYDRRLGPGDGFEEISLLRDVARTATIRAHSGAELWAVDRAPFLAALGASPTRGPRRPGSSTSIWRAAPPGPVRQGRPSREPRVLGRPPQGVLERRVRRHDPVRGSGVQVPLDEGDDRVHVGLAVAGDLDRVALAGAQGHDQQRRARVDRVSAGYADQNLGVELAGRLGDDRGRAGVEADGGADDDGLAGHGVSFGLLVRWAGSDGGDARQGAIR